MYCESWSSPRGDETEEAEAVSRFEPSPLKMWVLMVGEITGGISPPHASGQQQCLPRAVSPASLAHSSMETSHPALTAPCHGAPGHSARFTAAGGSCYFPLSHYNSILMRLPSARLSNRRLHVSACGLCGDIWVHLVCSWECIWTQKRGGKKKEGKKPGRSGKS